MSQAGKEDMRARRLVAVSTLAVSALAVTAGCSSPGSSHARPTVNATVSAELQQGKLLVAACFPGTLLDKVHTVHLVFLSSATGKHGAAVVAARDKLFGCLHISDPQKRKDFLNNAGEAALHASPSLARQDGRVKYFQITLPRIVLAAGGTSAGMGTSTAQPTIPGLTASP